jgi:hypothetical protein
MSKLPKCSVTRYPDVHMMSKIGEHVTASDLILAIVK